MCCLLDGEGTEEYADLLGAYRTHFGTDCVCHAPIPDFQAVDEVTFQNAILPFLEEADESD